MTEDNINEQALLATENIIKLAQEYTKQMSMPPEATSSVLRTLQAAQALKAMVQSQLALKPETKRKMLVTKEPISDQLLASIDEYCMANTFPYSFISIIQGKIYPMAQGLNLKMLADPRILRKMELVSKEVTTPIDKDGKTTNYIVRITKRATFANGEQYEATGVADYLEVVAKNKAATPAIVEMKAETRAERRCAMKALPLMGMVIEDSADVEGDKSEDAQSAF
jgi:hypothetical protein